MIDRDLSSIIHQLTNSQAAQPFSWLAIYTPAKKKI
jgi:hypothetical protein